MSIVATTRASSPRNGDDIHMFGNHLKLDIRGASHARAIRFTLENFPAGFRIDTAELAAFMERRAPGRDKLSTQRHETDAVIFTAGVTVRGDGAPAVANGVVLTTGSPICGLIENHDMRPADYGAERTIPRPGHADFGQWVTMGRIPTGGGKNSGRLTAALCAAGGICKQFLKTRGIDVVAELGLIGGKTDEKGMTAEIEKARKAGDSVGGIVSCTVTCPPVGLGGALFDGLESELSAALFAIPGVKGVTFGECGGGTWSDIKGDATFLSREKKAEASSILRDRNVASPLRDRNVASPLRDRNVASPLRDRNVASPLWGSAYNDAFVLSHGEVVTKTNRHGGILGGRTSGMPITFEVWLKPTPTVYVEQDSVDLATMKPAKLAMKGRHDPCIVRRAVPVVEAVTAFVLADAILADEAAHPRICLTLTGKTLEEDVEQYKSQRYFTDMVELRVDLLKKSERAKVVGFPEMLRTCGHTPRPVPVILTYRRKCDGGAFEGPESERLKFFRRILHSPLPQFAYVDFEEDFGDADLVALAHAAGAKVVRSLHDFTGPVKNLPARLKKLAAAGDIAKVAFMPRNLKDVSRLFSDAARYGAKGDATFLSREKKAEASSILRDRNVASPLCDRNVASPLRDRNVASPLRDRNVASPLRDRNVASPLNCIVIAMGPMGLATRVLAGRLGAPWTYASVPPADRPEGAPPPGGASLSALGHLTPYELVRDYRFRTVTREATLYGVTGWPLKKTRSPELHNAAFAAEDEDALMIPFPAKTAHEAISFMKAMDMRGLAVTIPHKFGVMPLLDRVDAEARRIGAVNTVVRAVDAASCRVERKGVHDTFIGFNTDIYGFAEALQSFTGPLNGRKVAVLGDGGAAQAVKAALRRIGVKFKVFHRATPPQGYDVLVNATPVDPIPDYLFTGKELVYDLGYVPEVTPLMARAAKAGCKVENGFKMLAAQARYQRELWGIGRGR